MCEKYLNVKKTCWLSVFWDLSRWTWDTWFPAVGGDDLALLAMLLTNSIEVCQNKLE